MMMSRVKHAFHIGINIFDSNLHPSSMLLDHPLNTPSPTAQSASRTYSYRDDVVLHHWPIISGNLIFTHSNPKVPPPDRYCNCSYPVKMLENQQPDELVISCLSDDGGGCNGNDSDKEKCENDSSKKRRHQGFMSQYTQCRRRRESSNHEDVTAARNVSSRKAKNASAATANTAIAATIIDIDDDIDDDDEVVVLDLASPDEGSKVSKKDGKDDSQNKNNGDRDDSDDDNDEIQIVGEANVTRLPHNRQDCLEYRYVLDGNTPSNASFCSLCYCFVCDKLASECVNWVNGGSGITANGKEKRSGNGSDNSEKIKDEDLGKNHCNATDKGKKGKMWRRMRNDNRNGYTQSQNEIQRQKYNQDHVERHANQENGQTAYAAVRGTTGVGWNDRSCFCFLCQRSPMITTPQIMLGCSCVQCQGHQMFVQEPHAHADLPPSQNVNCYCPPAHLSNMPHFQAVGMPPHHTPLPQTAGIPQPHSPFGPSPNYFEYQQHPYDDSQLSHRITPPYTSLTTYPSSAHFQHSQTSWPCPQYPEGNNYQTR